MALDDYAGLKAEVGNWMARGDINGDVETFIKLAEARLNRELKPVVSDAPVAGVQGSREIDIAAQNCVEPIALFHVSASGDEYLLSKRAAGTFAFYGDVGEPLIWSADDNSKLIKFDRPCADAYVFRFRAKRRFGLSDSAPTNWLLTNHPDVYLAACLMWGGGFIKDGGYAASFKGVLDEGLAEVAHAIAEQNRAVLPVDPALSSIGRRRPFL